jgi:hypothetical protein
MQFYTILLGISLPLLALSAPTERIAKRSLSTELNGAVAGWLQDTGFVSSFLDYAVSTFPTPPANLLANAAAALNAELDELSHKAILDSNFIFVGPQNQAVINAYDVLVTQGTFMQVVNGLRTIAATGDLSQVATINTVRCGQVLPAIDVYFAAVAEALGQTGAYAAIRPAACGGVNHG